MAILGSLFDGLRMSTPPFFPQPGSAAPMIPGMGEPSPTPKPQWLEKLNSPMAQIGLAMLANSRGANGRPNPFGQVAGNAVLGYQQSQRSNAEEELKRKYMEAQIKRMQEPQADGQEPAQLQLLRALQKDPALLELQKQLGGGNAQSMPSSIQEWEYFNNLPEDQKKQFLNMKRQPTAPQLSIVNGVPTLIDRINGSQNPLSTIQGEADAQQKLAEAKGIGTAQGEAQGGIQKKGSAAGQTLVTLDMAEPLIDAATGSLAGAGVDKLAAVFGQAPKGAEAIAGLKVLQANLMTSMPRMEGPQSDRDVQLYKEAAGQIGDPKVPAAIKKAAVKTIRSINERYQQAAGIAPTSGNGQKVRRYNPQTGKIE